MKARSSVAARSTSAATKKGRAAAPRPRPPARPEGEGLREKHPGRPEQTPAFFADARHATDSLAEELGESFILSATSGEDPEEHHERELPQEEGGPFLETSGRTEFGYGVDESNPEDAEPAPWPSVSPEPPHPYRPGGPR
jgi:hypothetical protein